MTQSHDVDRFHRTFDRLVILGRAGAEQRQIRYPALGYNLLHAKVKGQLQFLRNQSHTAWEMLPRPFPQPLALHQDTSRRGLQQSRGQLQHGGFAHAVGAQQRNHFLRLDAER